MSQEKSQLPDTKKTQKSLQQNDDYIKKPDRSKFLEELNALRSQLDGARAKLAKHRQEIESQSAATGQSEKESKIREEHSAVVNERNRLRDAEKKITAEADRIEESVKRKVAEIQSLRPKNGPRTVKDLEQKVKDLESLVDTGSLSIVEEQKVLREVTALKRQRNSFVQSDKLQAEVTEIRKKAADLRKTVDQTALRKITAKKAELETQLDSFKEERRSNRSKINSVYDARRAVQAEIKEINAKMDELRKDFDQRMDDFNAKLKAKKEQREAEEKHSKIEQAKQKKVSEAQAKVDAAKEPAFSQHIEQAKALLTFFDPSYVPESKPAANDKSAATTTNGDKPLNRSTVNKHTRPAVQAKPAAQPASQAPPSRKSQKLKAKETAAQGSNNTKLNFDFGIIDSLSQLNIALPTSTEEISGTVEKIKEKVKYFTENSERVTKEKVERAEKELQEVLKQFKTEEEETKPATAST